MDQQCTEVKVVKLWEPAEAALTLQRNFKRAANNLRRDYHLREDLVQEMSLAVLKCRRPHPLSFFMNRAVCRAINFLRDWECGKKRMEPLQPRDPRFSYDPEKREVRRQHAIAELKRRGAEVLLKEQWQREQQAMTETPQVA